jgi:hypothetical protein
MTSNDAAAVRPTHGRITRADGTTEPVRYVATDDPSMFLPVTVDGEPIIIGLGESLSADVLGPGQAIVCAFPDDGLPL